MIGAEHGNAGRQLIERTAMRIGKARQRTAHAFHFGGVDADAGAAGLGVEIQHVESPPRAGNDGAQPAGIGAVAQARLRDGFARAGVKQLQAAFDRVGSALGLDGARIGGVDEGQPAIGIARPYRRRQCFEERAQRGDLGR